MINAIGRTIAKYYSIVVVLLLWEAISRAHFVAPRLMPGLATIGASFWELTVSGDLLYHGSITLARAMTGFGAAIVCGIALGTLMARIKWFATLFEPIFSFTYPVPKIALYPVFVLAFGFGDMSKIVLIFLECLYPMTVQTYFGMNNAQRVLVWASRNMGANDSQLFWRVLVPSALPSIFAGIRIALPVALIVTIITEIIGESRGLGYVVQFASAQFDYARSLAALIAIGIIGFALDRSMIALQHRLVFWQRLETVHD